RPGRQRLPPGCGKPLRPRCQSCASLRPPPRPGWCGPPSPARGPCPGAARSEEHTSELQSRENLVCRLLLEKKKYKKRGRRDCAGDASSDINNPGGDRKESTGEIHT